MPQSLRLKRFTNVGILRRIDFPLLMRFFESNRAFRAFLADRGVTSTHDEGRFDFEALAHILMSPDVDTPEELLDALYFVDALSDPECYDRVLEECREAGIELGEKDPPPEDLALRAWLADPNILQRVHAEQYRARPEKFESYFTDRSDRPDFMAPSDATLRVLEADLDEWFEYKKKGRGTRVFPFVREDGVWLLIRHGQRIKREGTVEVDGGAGSIFYRPEKFDVLIYYPGEGELTIHAETKGERRAYCHHLGKHLFSDSAFFRYDAPVARYTLQPLIDLGRDAMACRDVEGLEHAHLAELHIAHESDQDDVEIRRASEDVFRALENQRRRLQDEEPAIRLVRAKFRLRFAGGRERNVMIEPPNIASFDHNADCAVVHDWLSRRGFIRKTEPEVTRGQPEVLLAAS